MSTETRSRKIAVCETQPLTIAGLRVALADRRDLVLTSTRTALEGAWEMAVADRPDVLVLDKTFGIQPVLAWLGEHKSLPNFPAPVIWGASITEAEALRFLQAGTRGIVRKTAEVETIIACLTAVAGGSTWMEDSVFGEAARVDRCGRSELTPREIQVMQLVEQGLKNKEIGRELGIRPGTVKIHLKHIFEKTGVRGRYGLALNGLKDRGLLGADPSENDDGSLQLAAVNGNQLRV
ncbi:MAG TPA: response regulator transcription factor [Bryobacteraceae bacterium]|nr:response regulator transcription factor [Bryobacteraceae bacterium]